MNILSVYGVGLPTGILLGFVYHLGAKVAAEILHKFPLLTLDELSRLMEILLC